MIDGRTIGDGRPGPMVARLQALDLAHLELDLAFRAGVLLA
jgi:branched-chain amino acid aminotransferase